MRYPGHFVQTRRGAFIIALCLSGAMMAFAGRRVDLSQPIQTVTLLIMTLMPLATTHGCLRFLKKMERTHDTPTPEMTFILRLAVTLSFSWSVFVMIALDHWG